MSPDGSLTVPPDHPIHGRSPVLSRLIHGAVALASVAAGKALIAVRLRRPPEGWRRTVGVLLRSEATRFALSAFSLRVPGAAAEAGDLEGRAAAALRAYLAACPDAHFDLLWRDGVTVRRRVPAVDVVLLRFAADGDLCSLTPFLADPGTLPAADADRAHAAIVRGYNRTRHLPTARRPSALRAAVEGSEGVGANAAAAAYARRLLSACCVSFDTVDPADPRRRFRPPTFCARRDLGFGFLSVVMRPDAGRASVDVWFSAHHVGLDGVPLQELVSGLENAWGLADAVTFPAADVDQPYLPPRRCSIAGERDVDEILTFVDFSPVTALRRALNERLAGAVGGPVTFGTLLAWLMHREPAFTGVRIASTVDVLASGGYERDVDVVPLRPADFVTGPGPWDGFVAFAREFNRLIGLSRTRRSPLRQQLQTAGLLPAWAHARAVYTAPAALDETFGSMCITIIREARVFVAPMTDLGLGHGFFAIGSTDLPAADGGRVASVSIKGDAGTIASHPAHLRRLIQAAASLPLPPRT